MRVFEMSLVEPRLANDDEARLPHRTNCRFHTALRTVFPFTLPLTLITWQQDNRELYVVSCFEGIDFGQTS
jgi:hypothetical protein